jgi:hypothetical protein
MYPEGSPRKRTSRPANGVSIWMVKSTTMGFSRNNLFPSVLDLLPKRPHKSVNLSGIQQPHRSKNRLLVEAAFENN